MDDKNKKEIVQGYEIKQSIVFHNNHGFALAENPKANLFVTWQFSEEDNGKRDYYWGHYIETENKAQGDYATRIAEYQKQYRIAERGSYTYYSTQRPIDIGTFPKTQGEPLRITNFDRREEVERGRFLTWGFLEYTTPLTQRQIDDYELKASFRNPDKAKMMEQAQIVGKWEQFKQVPYSNRLTLDPDFILFTPKDHITPEQMEQRYNQAIKDINRAAQKPPRIAEQLAEAEKQVQRGAEPPTTDKKPKREER